MNMIMNTMPKKEKKKKKEEKGEKIGDIKKKKKVIRLYATEVEKITWGAADARQERVIAEVVRKGIVVGKCWSMC